MKGQNELVLIGIVIIATVLVLNQLPDTKIKPGCLFCEPPAGYVLLKSDIGVNFCNGANYPCPASGYENCIYQVTFTDSSGYVQNMVLQPGSLTRATAEGANNRLECWLWGKPTSVAFTTTSTTLAFTTTTSTTLAPIIVTTTTTTPIITTSTLPLFPTTTSTTILPATTTTTTITYQIPQPPQPDIFMIIQDAIRSIIDFIQNIFQNI